jgi:hypothetical protein
MPMYSYLLLFIFPPPSLDAQAIGELRVHGFLEPDPGLEEPSVP